MKVSGDVNPNTILRVLERSSSHAELKSVRFYGKTRERDYYYGHNNAYPPPLYSMDYPYSLPGGLDYQVFESTNHSLIPLPLPLMPLPPPPPQTLVPLPQLLPPRAPPPHPPPASMAMAPGVGDVQKGSTGCSLM